MYQLFIAILMSICIYTSYVCFGYHIPWVKSSSSAEWKGAYKHLKTSIWYVQEGELYHHSWWNLDVPTTSQSKILVFEGEEHPTQARKSRSVGKRMMVAFFGKHGIIKTVMLEHQKTITVKWYTETWLPHLMETSRTCGQSYGWTPRFLTMITRLHRLPEESGDKDF